MKKQILFLLGGVLIVAVLVVIGRFLVTAPAPVPQDAVITGTWRVNKENGQTVAEEYMIFSPDAQARDLREGKEYLASEYTVQGNRLSLTAMKISFEITLLSQRQMILTGSDGSRRELMQVDGTDCAPDTLTGVWRVKMQAGKAVTGETITFETGTLTDRRDGKEYLKSAYTYQEGLLTLEQGNMAFEAFTCGEALMLWEREGGYVWELVREEA